MTPGRDRIELEAARSVGRRFEVLTDNLYGDAGERDAIGRVDDRADDATLRRNRRRGSRLRAGRRGKSERNGEHKQRARYANVSEFHTNLLQ